MVDIVNKLFTSSQVDGVNEHDFRFDHGRDPSQPSGILLTRRFRVECASLDGDNNELRSVESIRNIGVKTHGFLLKQSVVTCDLGPRNRLLEIQQFEANRA